ncbi:CRISPR-associated protein, YPO2467 family [Bathymodiolus azoricus thioautotrophic gill symbiont]|uniref:CRISPR-associated protein, YPO2467 family n=1 Tax=Bathymodiolus azoricus thioautotrophic gill symbiont TaxID=235205 RepID=A0A1H6J3W9_9GAMM|nr:CRISPR-associated protein, YPO2467 family [Bathymodiolus azoricus thioautotrophic gill symbiont]
MLSPKMDSLRYILALGLRTLTLQTGNEYQNKIGLKDDELAVLIGSKAINDLHYKDKVSELKNQLNRFRVRARIV